MTLIWHVSTPLEWISKIKNLQSLIYHALGWDMSQLKLGNQKNQTRNVGEGWWLYHLTHLPTVPQAQIIDDDVTIDQYYSKATRDTRNLEWVSYHEGSFKDAHRMVVAALLLHLHLFEFEFERHAKGRLSILYALLAQSRILVHKVQRQYVSSNQNLRGLAHRISFMHRSEWWFDFNLWRLNTGKLDDACLQDPLCMVFLLEPKLNPQETRVLRKRTKKMYFCTPSPVVQLRERITKRIATTHTPFVCSTILTPCLNPAKKKKKKILQHAFTYFTYTSGLENLYV